MKRIKLLFSAVFTTCLLQACHGDNGNLLGSDTTAVVADTVDNADIIVGADESKKITLPDSVSAEDQASIDSLAAKSGREFDIAYLDKTTADYKKALNMFEHTSKRAFDPQIKQFAAKNILTIQRHLDLIEAVRGSMR
jgi:putative membrane protein